MTDTQTSWLPDVLAKIDGYATLEKNWDSYGAEPADLWSMEYAHALAMRLSNDGVAKPAVGLSPDGHIGFSWDEGWCLDVDCEPDGQFSYVYLPKVEGTDYADDEVEGTTCDLNDLLQYLKP